MVARRIYVPDAMPSRDPNGRALPAKLRFYEPTGTYDTLKAVYTSDSLSVALAQPILSDANGRFPAIWGDSAEEWDVGYTDQVYDANISGPYSGVTTLTDVIAAAQTQAEAAADAAEASEDAAAASATAAAASATAAAASEDAAAETLASAVRFNEAQSLTSDEKTQARANIGAVIGTNVQAYSATLATLATSTAAGLALMDDADNAAQRTTLGLGTMATQAASAVAITGGAITGITDLAVADGGTGASSAGAARTNLGLGSIATQDASAVAVTGGTLAGITSLQVQPASDVLSARIRGFNTSAAADFLSVEKSDGSVQYLGVRGGTTPGVSVMGTFAASGFQGLGAENLQVLGSFAASKTSGEHRLINAWAANNVLAIQNTSNSDGYSAIRFLDYNGREAAAFGYGNPGTSFDIPFAGASYWETSTQINADGTPNTTIAPRPMRIVQSGYMTMSGGSQAQGVYCRADFTAAGEFKFYDLNANFSAVKTLIKFSPYGGFTATFNAVDGTSPILRVRQINGLTNTGITVGSTYETTPPQVAGDFVGTVLAGTNVDSGRPSNFSDGGTAFAFATYQPAAQQMRLVRPSVVKVDFLLQTASSPLPIRLDIRDTDNSNKVPLRISLDGKQNIFLCGATDVGGASGGIALANAAVIPGSTPTGGGVIYSESGALKWKGSSGTVTQLAAA